MKNKLRGMILYKNDTIPELAKALKMSQATLSHKMNGKTEFSRQDIMRIKNRYGLTPDEVDNIFFSDEVS
ncbi:MAG: helix-turn-helix transcriptional regulator [Clostridia bacterium]|nr:helix-turn-helix transcriptional regulator [Clostridia bacterium]